MTSPSEDWLKKLNLEYRAANVHPRARPFQALGRYAHDFNVKSVEFSSPEASKIFEWFVANTKEDAHKIGSMFVGAYYFDSCFWPSEVPIAFGRIELDPGISLRTMPEAVRQDVLTTHENAWEFAIFWANSFDYAYGLDDIFKLTPKSKLLGLSLLANADRELRAATSQLLEHHPNPKAAMSSRMAVEIFMKAFLVLKDDIQEPAVRAFNHHLDKLLRAIRKTSPQCEILKIEEHIHVFPEIADRYVGDDIENSKLWASYSLALHVGSVVAREFSDRNLLARVLASGAP